MNSAEKCQFDFADDFEVYPGVRVEIDGFTPGRPSTGGGFCDPTDDYEPWEYDQARVIMTINGTEIELPEATAEKALKAVNVRLDAKLDDMAAALYQDAALRAADEVAIMQKYDEQQLQNDVEKILFAKGA